MCLASTLAVGSPSFAANALSTTVTTPNMTITISAVDQDTFHVVAYPTGLLQAPVSPFIVETSLLPNSRIAAANGGTAVKTSAGSLTVTANGDLSLTRASGAAALQTISLTNSNDSVLVAMKHDPSDLLYGAGNQSENHAGDLTHPSGTQADSNGVTRIPFLWSSGGWSVLIANDRTGASWNDAAGTLTWTLPEPSVDMYLSIAQGAGAGYQLLDAYSRLTGRAPIPPRWTFGYMQSRWGYTDAKDVQDKWSQFRDRQIPVDAFIYDYDWFVNDWNFNPTTFPSGSLQIMKTDSLHFVGIRKPRVNGDNLNYAKSQGWILVAPFGTDLRFDIPEASAWWWSHQAPLVQAGVDGWWNDEAEQTPDEFFYMAKTEWEGGRALNNHRPWSISRAFSPGMQRFGAAVWTGDIDSSWAAFSNQPGTLLNWSLAGMPYCGQDIGGFQSTPSPELYARWIEEGVFVPVMRAHGTFDSPRWPWAFGADVLAATTKAIDLRYRLIPYLYSYANETANTGAPIMRPLFLEFPNDSKALNLEDEWLVGRRLLAAPVLSQGGARDIYLPIGSWYDFNTGAHVNGGESKHIQVPLDTIPAYVRAGSIIPLGPVIQSTGKGVEDPLEIRIYPGADDAFTLYEDDGSTYAYQTGAFSKIPMVWDDQNKSFTAGARIGTYPGMLTTRHLVLVLPDGTSKSVTYTGANLSVHL